MGIRSMVQFTVRVAAFAAVAALLLQVSCTVAPPASANAQIGAHDDSGCHEPAPSTPNTPDSSHGCCSGDHSADALLSTIVTPSPLVLDGAIAGLTPALHSLTPTSTGFAASFSPPYRPLPLRI